MSRRVLVAIVALGVAVAIGVPAGWVLSRPDPNVGERAAATLDPSPGRADASGRPPGDRRGSAGPAPGSATTPGAGPAVPSHDGRPGREQTERVAAPVTVDIPAIGVHAPVMSVGVGGDGELEIPTDVRTLGWYRYGPAPGAAAGSVVVAGHIDSAVQGKGAFFRLGRLRPGDRLTVTVQGGRSWRYRVVAREEWPKPVVPLDRIFSLTGAPRLTLVTCGGGFREDIRSYVDNVAVTAVPDGTA
jgi:Sortase domain